MLIQLEDSLGAGLGPELRRENVVRTATARLGFDGKFAVSLAPGAMTFTRSSLLAWQSREEKIRSAPLVTRNSI